MFVVLGSKVPPPPLQMPPVATVTLPLKAAFALFPQSTWSRPAFAVGEGVKVTFILSTTALQTPLPVEVSRIQWEPEETSAAVGV